MARPRPLSGSPSRGRHELRKLACAFLASLLPALATGCQAWDPGNPSPSRRLSDGTTTWTRTRLRGVTPQHQIGWLDNRTILFIGWSRSQGRGLYAWDQKGPARLILADAYRFCHDGNTWTIRVSRKEPGSQKRTDSRHRLNPATLATTPLGPPQKPPGGGSENPFTCNEEPVPEALRNRRWQALRPGDGYLDLGAIGEKNPEASLLKADGQTRIALGIPVKEQLATIADYSDHGKAYIIYDLSFPDSVLQSWTKLGSLNIWSLRGDGQLQTLSLPAGPWAEVSSGDRLIQHSRESISISSSGGSSSPNTTAGLYQIRKDKAFTKLDTGIIPHLAASPDGCQLAYKLSGKNRDGELRSVELCTRST